MVRCNHFTNPIRFLAAACKHRENIITFAPVRIPSKICRSLHFPWEMGCLLVPCFVRDPSHSESRYFNVGQSFYHPPTPKFRFRWFDSTSVSSSVVLLLVRIDFFFGIIFCPITLRHLWLVRLCNMVLCLASIEVATKHSIKDYTNNVQKFYHLVDRIMRLGPKTYTKLR